MTVKELKNVLAHMDENATVYLERTIEEGGVVQGYVQEFLMGVRDEQNAVIFFGA